MTVHPFDWASSSKMICPGCDSESSTIKGARERGEGCPCCGLSSEAMTEVAAARYRHGETTLTERLAELLGRAEKAEREAYRLRSHLATIKATVAAFDAEPEGKAT